MFRYIDVTTKSSVALLKLVTISEEKYARHVRQINFEFQLRIEQTMQWQAFAKTLSSCLLKFPNLTVLEFQSLPAFVHGIVYRNIIDSLFAALWNGSLGNLREFEVVFPLVPTFRSFSSDNNCSSRIQTEGLKSLRKLTLCATHTPGPGRLWVIASPLNTELSHPFKLVELAVNLTSLSIVGNLYANRLNLETLHFPQTHLTYIHLNQVAISSQKLRSIFVQSEKTIRTVKLKDIRLRSGTWQAILLPMSEFLHLVNFTISSSGYSSIGTSSNLVPSHPSIRRPQIEVSSNPTRRPLSFGTMTGASSTLVELQGIETLFLPDFGALAKLQHQVSVNRAQNPNWNLDSSSEEPSVDQQASMEEATRPMDPNIYSEFRKPLIVNPKRDN